MALFAPTHGRAPNEAQRGTRAVHADGRWHEAPVYERLELAVGARVQGPALLEQPDTTIYVDPGLHAEVDRFGNLVIQPVAECAP